MNKFKSNGTNRPLFFKKKARLPKGLLGYPKEQYRKPNFDLVLIRYGQFEAGNEISWHSQHSSFIFHCLFSWGSETTTWKYLITIIGYCLAIVGTLGWHWAICDLVKLVFSMSWVKNGISKHFKFKTPQTKPTFAQKSIRCD